MRKRIFVLITLEGWVYIGLLVFLLVGALARQINLLIVLYGLMTGPLVLSWRMVRATLQGLELRRHMPDRVRAGEAFRVVLEIVVPRRRWGGWSLRAQDRLVQGAETLARPQLYFPYIAGGSSRSLSYQLRCERRGRYRLGPVRVMSRFPCGLLRASLSLGKVEELLVTPRLGQLSPQWKRLLRARHVGAGGGQPRRGTLEGDFYGLREWRSDDSRRWIHWRTSARRQTLVVRQFEQAQQHEVVLFVDLGPSPPTTPTQQADLETLLSFVATTLEELAHDASTSLRLELLGAERHTVAGSFTASLLDEALSHLSLARPAAVDLLPTALVETLSQTRRGARVVVLAARPLKLDDPSRFATVWQSPAMQSWQERVLAVDVTSPEGQSYFSSTALDAPVVEPVA